MNSVICEKKSFIRFCKEADKNDIDVHLNRNCTLLHNPPVRIRKPIGETKIPQFI